jgi:hypothetical protein
VSAAVLPFSRPARTCDLSPTTKPFGCTIHCFLFTICEAIVVSQKYKHSTRPSSEISIISGVFRPRARADTPCRSRTCGIHAHTCKPSAANLPIAEPLTSHVSPITYHFASGPRGFRRIASHKGTKPQRRPPRRYTPGSVTSVGIVSSCLHFVAFRLPSPYRSVIILARKTPLMKLRQVG